MTKLREKEIMCAKVLTEAGQSVRHTAQQLGIAESTLRYRLQRHRQGALDNRKAVPPMTISFEPGSKCKPSGRAVLIA